MAPKVNGSSTMGVKKSTVCTSACSGEMRYTPASSALSKPTRTLGSCCRANFPSTESSAAGLSLDAQPAAFTDSVSRNGLVSGTDIIVIERRQALPRNGVEQGKIVHHGVAESQSPKNDANK